MNRILVNFPDFPQASFLICAWRWLTYMIKDTWLSACLEAFQGLSQWKQLGFIFNLIILWKSLVYKHICLTSNHFDLMLRSLGSACCHSFAHVAVRRSRTPFLLQASLGSTTFLTFSIATHCSLLMSYRWTPLNTCHCYTHWGLFASEYRTPHSLHCFHFFSSVI